SSDLPIRELNPLLGLGRGGLGLLGGLLDLFLRGLADRLLLLDLPLQLADLLLRLSELLFEEPEPLLSRRFRRGPPGGADEARREHDDEHESLLHPHLRARELSSDDGRPLRSCRADAPGRCRDSRILPWHVTGSSQKALAGHLFTVPSRARNRSAGKLERCPS